MTKKVYYPLSLKTMMSYELIILTQKFRIIEDDKLPVIFGPLNLLYIFESVCAI